MGSEIEDIEKLSILGMVLFSSRQLKPILGLTLDIKIGGESFIGEVFYYDSQNKLMILREKFGDGESFNLRYINSTTIDELKIVAKGSLAKLETELSEIDFQSILSQEGKNMEYLKKKSMIDDPQV